MNIDVITAGVPHSISDGVTCTVIEAQGLGMMPLHRLSERGPQQHGESDRGWRGDSRIVMFKLFVAPPDLEAKRDSLAQWFIPRNVPLSLRFVRGDGQVRQLDGHYLSDMDWPIDPAYRYSSMFPVRVRCDPPAFYDPAGVAAVFALAAGGEEWEIPWEIPWKIGASTLDVSTPVTYPGTHPSYPVITVDGPINDLVITNNATGEKLDFTGDSVAVGEQRVIDLRYGNKTVVDELGADCIALLTTDSDLATWHLAPHPDAPGGINSIQVTGSACAASTRVAIQFFVWYVSL